MNPSRRRATSNPRARLAACLVGLVIVAGRSVARADGASEELNNQDEFWAHLKNMRAGPVTFELGGQVRLRYEYQDGSTLKGYEPGGHDQLIAVNRFLV